MHKNHPRRRIPSSSVSRVMMMTMKPLKIFVLLSSVVVLFENLDRAFGEVSAASTTGRRGALSSADDASSFDLLDKEDASSDPEEEKKMNS